MKFRPKILPRLPKKIFAKAHIGHPQPTRVNSARQLPGKNQERDIGTQAEES